MNKQLFGETLGINRERLHKRRPLLSDASSKFNQPAQKLSNTGTEKINRPKKPTIWGM